MFAYPPQAGFFGQCFFQNRCGIHEYPVTERAAVRLNLLRQFLQAFAHQFMVIASEGIAGHHTHGGLREQAFNIRCSFRQVVHTDGYDPQCAGFQFLRPAAACTVALHIMHLAMKPV